MNKSQLVALYIDAEKRSLPCALGQAFLAEDRLAIVNGMRALKVGKAELARMIDHKLGNIKDEFRGYMRHYARLSIFEQQVAHGKIILGHAATGESIGSQEISTGPFDGRIRSQADIQPAFNRAAKALLKVGITTPQDAAKYLVNGFEYVRQEQKIDLKAQRIVQELQLGDLTREQVLATLDKVKASF